MRLILWISLIVSIPSLILVFIMTNADVIEIPVWSWTLGSTLTMILLSLPTLGALYRLLGRKFWQVFIVLSGFAWGIETIAILTKLPYGGFEYGENLGWKLGVVPWSIGFAWAPIALFGWVIVRKFAKKWQRVFVGALVMTWFDLALDPAATALQFWIWDTPQGFYGVPWSNFMGWVISSFIGMLILEWLMRDIRTIHDRTLQGLGLSGMISLALWIWTNIWLGLTIPALLGLGLWMVGMSRMR